MIFEIQSSVVDTLTEEDLYYGIFTKYKKDYSKSYQNLSLSHPLVQKRFKAFKLNLQRIVEHNEKYEKGLYTFTLGLNPLADLTDTEYQQMLGYKKKSKQDISIPSYASEYSIHDFNLSDVPEQWDWREHDAVTPVKNQGMCGSCWSFSAVASLESVYARHTGNLISFSEQELVDCTLNGIDTCTHGGEMQDGFNEIIQHHQGKIEKEEDYPYEATSKGKCLSQDSKGIGSFNGYKNVTTGDENALKGAVAQVGVVSVAIDASSFLFQLYRHGVFNWPLCKNKQDQLDHGVAVVGYGRKASRDFWLVKNSWGSNWGMHGYIMMSRNKHNQCGIATDACFPTMKKD